MKKGLVIGAVATGVVGIGLFPLMAISLEGKRLLVNDALSIAVKHINRTDFDFEARSEDEKKKFVLLVDEYNECATAYNNYEAELNGVFSENANILKRTIGTFKSGVLDNIKKYDELLGKVNELNTDLVKLMGMI